MFPLIFLRPSIRRPLLALLIAGGVMTMSPVHAALPIDNLLGGDDPTAIVGEALGGDPTDVVGEALGGDPTDVVGDALGGDLLGGDLLGGDLLGGDLLGGDLLDGDVLGGNSSDSASPQPADSGDPDSGISIAGIHMGMSGHVNSLEELLDVCDGTTGRIGTSIQGIGLGFGGGVPGAPCPEPALPVSPAPPVSPRPPTSPAPRVSNDNPRANPAVLPAPLETLGTFERAVTPAHLSVPAPAAAPVPAVTDSAPAAAPTSRGPLPRTGPDALLQGPFAFGLLGLSAAVRAAIARRRQ